MKILYVTTISNTIEFLTSHIKMLVDYGHKVDVAFNKVRDVDYIVKKLGCKIYDISFQRNPIKKENLLAYKQLKKIIIDGKYDIVHTHTPVASAIVRLVCKDMNSVKVIYTAHGFHFYKGASLKNWLLYYPIEKYLSKYTDVLITINKEDYNLAKNNFFSKNVEYMPSVGLNIEKFKNIDINKIEKRKEIGVPEDCFLILSVGELNKNKNHEVIIKAISKLKNEKIHFVICGVGILRDYLIRLSRSLCIEDKVHLLGYRKDIGEICKCSDIFAFPSKREGLGMAALEAMACGLPIITSNVHGINDYSINGITGFSCKSSDVDEFSQKIYILYNDISLCKKIGYYNISSVKKYDVNNSIENMKNIYNNYI